MASELDMSSMASLSLASLAAPIEPDSPKALSDDMLSERMANFCLHMIKHRQRSLYWHEQGYPGCFANMLGSPVAVAKLLDRMKNDWGLWGRVQQLPGTAWHNYRKRSSFQLVAVRKAFSAGGSARTVCGSGCDGHASGKYPPPPRSVLCFV